ncbi:MAG: thioredoxin domain-containing protein [Proteobacteria bacterium]|nr:thioredoxin domain-containing protein [Cystobacterineae bacterium]MCL2259602.1 thioredoxin domain-containing protein [Cystobacterineae bacterium]MCL2313925.1 thioredoxin domain-containing protein [Pseudomonadota bacterium]
MSKHSHVVVLVASLVFVFGLNACTPPQGKGAVSRSAQTTVAATFNNKTLTLKEIDTELGESLHEARKRAASSMAFKAILEEKAKQAGVSAKEMMDTEIQARTKPPTEAEVMAVFEASRARLPPETKFEDVRGDIENYLRSQSGAKVAQELQDAWLADAQFKFSLVFEPKRVEVEAIGPSMGAEKAKVTIVEFSDFECPYCRQGAKTVAEVVKAYPEQVKLYFRQFPLDFHPKAPKAAQAALCAHEQGKFWEYHDVLFENQDKLEVGELKEHAKALSLDDAKFAECLDSERHAETVQKDMEAGRAMGISGTPAFFINGILLGGAYPIEKFKEMIEQELQAK